MPAKNASQQVEAVNNNVLVLIGRLLEATEAAQLGMRALDEETRSNSQQIQQLKTTVDTISTTVHALDTILRLDAGNLLGRVREAAADVMLNKNTLERHAGRLDALEKNQNANEHGRNAWLKMAEYAAFFITSGIAIYAAIGQWASAGGSR